MNDAHILTLLRHRQEELRRQEQQRLRYQTWREAYPRPIPSRESRWWQRLSRLAALFLS